MGTSVATERAIALVANHCDIVERLDLIPPSACVRGLYLRSLAGQVERRGKLAEYREYFPTDRYSSLPFYPVADYIVRIACAGALVASPASVHEGMYDLTRSHATTFATSLLGRAMLRLLARDPVRLTEQGLAARRQTYNYGQWKIVRHGDRELEMVYSGEYQWIESAVAGAAVGTFEACGLAPELETKLEDRFSGSTFVRW